jgi:hypothetical protein
MRYQKIESKIWFDEKFIRLSPMQQRLFFYILTCPHGNLTGLFVLKRGYIIEDLNYLAKDLEKDLESLCESNLIYFDKDTQVVFIKNFLKHNPITNPNQRKAAVKIITDLPKSKLIQKFLVVNKELAKALPEVLLKPETETETETEAETETEVLPLSTAEPIDGGNGFNLQSLAELWNELRPSEIAKVKIPFVRNAKTIKKFQSTLKLHPDREWWEELFMRIHYSNFMKGQNKNGWRATFDWLMDNAEKVFDGHLIDAGVSNQAERSYTTAQQWVRDREAKRSGTA